MDDLAYTVMIFRRAGAKVSRASLVLLSRTYRFGDSTHQLFEMVDKTDDVNKRATEFRRAVLFDQNQPVPELVSACREYPTYEGECLGFRSLTHSVGDS